MGEIDFENMNDDVKEYAPKETERTEKYLKSDHDKILNILKQKDFFRNTLRNIVMDELPDINDIIKIISIWVSNLLP